MGDLSRYFESHPELLGEGTAQTEAPAEPPPEEAPAPPAPEPKPEPSKEPQEPAQEPKEEAPPPESTEPPAPSTEPQPETAAPADQAGTPPVSDPPKPKTFRIKVDGEEIELAEEDLIRKAQLAEAAQRRMQEASQATKGAKATLEGLLRDPIGTYRQILLGRVGNEAVVDRQIRTILETELARKVEEDSLPPEQRIAIAERRRLEAEVNRLKAEAAKAKDELTKNLENQTMLQLDKEVHEAMKTSGLPDQKVVVKRIAQVMLEHEEAGIQLTAAEAAKMIKAERDSYLASYLKTLSPDELKKIGGQVAAPQASAAGAAPKPSTTNRDLARPTSTSPHRRSTEDRAVDIVTFRKMLRERAR